MLWGLLVIPILFVLFINSYKNYFVFTKSKNFFVLKNYANVPSKLIRFSIGFLILLCVTGIIIGLAEPYIFLKDYIIKYENVRLIFIVDVSPSMAYAEDIAPNRLQASKEEIKKIYGSLDGKYTFCLIPFAGEPNPYYCPPTSSSDAFLMMLQELDLFTEGTDITAAIEAFNKIIVKEYKLDESGVNLVILLSDGGREEALATERIKLLNIVRDLGRKNFKFYAVGVGGKEATPLIRRNNDKQFIDYQKDQYGKTEYSKLDEEILEKIAKVGNGRYFNFQAKDELVGFLNDVIKENRVAGGSSVVFKRQYLQSYLFACAAIMLFISNIINWRFGWKTNYQNVTSRY
jgi:hypothetical protein